MEIVKNPIIIGLLAGTVTYAYLTWDINEKNKKKSKKGHSKKEVNLLIPLVVAVIGWFIAYAYFQYNGENENSDIIIPNITGTRKPLPLPINRTPSYRFTKDVISESSDPKSFSLLTGGVTVPSKLPDVLIDMY
jgi:hypothetical protein